MAPLAQQPCFMGASNGPDLLLKSSQPRGGLRYSVARPRAKTFPSGGEAAKPLGGGGLGGWVI
jgi:hypothetical protein